MRIVNPKIHSKRKNVVKPNAFYVKIKMEVKKFKLSVIPRMLDIVEPAKVVNQRI